MKKKFGKGHTEKAGRCQEQLMKAENEEIGEEGK